MIGVRIDALSHHLAAALSDSGCVNLAEHLLHHVGLRFPVHLTEGTARSAYAGDLPKPSVGCIRSIEPEMSETTLVSLQEFKCSSGSQHFGWRVHDEWLVAKGAKRSLRVAKHRFGTHLCDWAL